MEYCSNKLIEVIFIELLGGEIGKKDLFRRTVENSAGRIISCRILYS